MSGVFITATGTDSGKTYLTCALIRHFRAAGMPAHAFKPVVSGYEETSVESSDTFLLAHALGIPWSAAVADALSPWRYAAPISPHLAARQEGRALAGSTLLEACRRQLAAYPRLLVEGAGGALSPLCDDLLCADAAAALGLPAMLVTSAYVGALSHTLTALEALQRRDVTVAGIVVNEPAGPTGILNETMAALRHFTDVSCPILPLPYGAGDDSVSPVIRSIAEQLS